MYGLRAANRYAKALLEYALQQNALEKVFQDMSLIHSTINTSKDLERLLLSPVVKTIVKKNVLDKVFVGISPQVGRFLEVLIANKRLSILNQVAEKFIIQYNEYKNNKTAVVTTAVPLTSGMRDEMLKKIQMLTGNANITLESKVDSNIIGGFILRIGDIQYNASIAHKLNKLKQDFQQKIFA